jgi:ribosomal protein L37AE/L43A
MPVDNMKYCPNCSALLEDETAPVCQKCGFDREAAQLDELRRREERFGMSPNKPPAASPQESEESESEHKCPSCGGNLFRSRTKGLSFDMLGKEVTIHDVRIMGMNLRKKAITQCVVEFEGWECSNKHRFFTNYSSSCKELCPICKDTMKKFGSQLRSCTHCKLNIPGDSYMTIEPVQLMEEEGWVYKESLTDEE